MYSEYAYDRQSKIGKLDKALDEATARSRTVVDIEAGLEDGFSTREVSQP